MYVEDASEKITMKFAEEISRNRQKKGPLAEPIFFEIKEVR
jgi:hypothetical protein